MIDVVNRSYLFISIIFNSQASNEIIDLLKQEDHLPSDWKHWNDPELPDELLKSAKRVQDLLDRRRQADPPHG